MAKTLRAKSLEAVQKLARIQAADDNGFCECVTCGVVKHYKEMHGGHFIAKGASSRWALEEENIHPQCPACNLSGNVKNKLSGQRYTLWMVDWYGRDFVDHMIATRKEIKKMYKSDYEDLIKKTKEEIKFHEKRIGET